MTTLTIIAIPFLTIAIPMLVLGFTIKKTIFFILGGVFMSLAVVNAVIGYTMT